MAQTSVYETVMVQFSRAADLMGWIPRSVRFCPAQPTKSS